MRKTYVVKEIFYSPQGEGHRVGTMNVFVRFAGCNLQCVDRSKLLMAGEDRPRLLKGNEVDAGFFCDTDFQNGAHMTTAEILDMIKLVGGRGDSRSCKNVIFTGGEPSLQLDNDLVSYLHQEGYYVAIETNGTRSLARGIDWISCSPKPGTDVILRHADEVRCVVKKDQIPWQGNVIAFHKFVSPAFEAPPVEQIPNHVGCAEDINRENVAWALDWCERYPDWRISLQLHKILGVR